MPRRRVCTSVLIIAIIAAFYAVGIVSAQPLETHPLQVLFIGNSYTYYNNLPEMFAGLAKSAAVPRHVEVRMIAPGGVTLEEHWKKGRALAAIHERRWDWVVLQEQSQLGAKLVNGRSVINDPENFYEFARLFDAEVKSSGAKPIFLLTWARRDLPSQQDSLNYAYMRIGKELKTPVIPVGLAWRALRAVRPDLALYAADGSHPSPAGTYLAACMIYAALFGESPEGLVAEISGRPIPTFGAPISSEVTEPLVTLSGSDALRIQQITWKTYARLRYSGGYLDVQRPADTLELPKLPARRPMPHGGDLAGIWIGSLMLYSNPATLELRLKPESGQWTAAAIVQVETPEGSSRNVYTAADFAVTDFEISFKILNPTGTGDDEKYRGVFTGETLAGIAEFGAADDPPYLLGSWELKRR